MNNENYRASIQKQLDDAGLSGVKATVGSFVQGERVEYDIQLEGDERMVSQAKSLLKLDQ